MPFGNSQLYDPYYDPYEGFYTLGPTGDGGSSGGGYNPAGDRSPVLSPLPPPQTISTTAPTPAQGQTKPVTAHSDYWSAYDKFQPGVPGRKTGGNVLGSQPFFIPNAQQTTTTSNILPTMGTPPPIPEYPALNIPEWDTGKVRSKTQAAAAPGLRRLRGEVRKAQMASYDNPNVKRMTLRDALAGYGQGIENVLGGARREAISEYQAEYAPQVSKAQTEYSANVQRINTNFQAAWKDYMSRVAQQTIRY